MAVQTCDQAITFRNFDYSRALEIVQDEEYLDDSDFDEIRLRRKQGEVFQAIDNFQEKAANNFDILSEDSDIAGDFDYESNHREKRSLFCDNDSSVVRKKRSIFCSNNYSNYTTSTGTSLLDPPIRTVATVIAAAVILIAANPPPGLVPSSSPQPGTLGGGGLPSANPGNTLDLLPPGTVPVATFPPFNPAGRTIPAVAVIFREPPGTVAGTDLTYRRSSSYSRQPTLLDRFLKNIRCLGPRLTAKFGRKPAPVVDYGYGKAKYHQSHPNFISLFSSLL